MFPDIQPEEDDVIRDGKIEPGLKAMTARAIAVQARWNERTAKAWLGIVEAIEARANRGETRLDLMGVASYTGLDTDDRRTVAMNLRLDGYDFDEAEALMTGLSKLTLTW